MKIMIQDALDKCKISTYGLVEILLSCLTIMGDAFLLFGGWSYNFTEEDDDDDWCFTAIFVHMVD